MKSSGVDSTHTENYKFRKCFIISNNDSIDVNFCKNLQKKLDFVMFIYSLSSSRLSKINSKVLINNPNFALIERSLL